MSLAVLARKTKEKRRMRSTTCGRIRNQGRSAGFVLNMTGRGANGIRTGPKPTAKYNSGGCKVGRWNSGVKCGFGCKGCCEVSCKGGQRDSCCGGNHIVSKKCRTNCKLCWYQGLSQPAPQMSYGVYLARKSNGAYRPSGRACCDCGKYSECNANLAANPKTNPNTWKQSPNISAGTIIERKRLAAITCAQQQRTFKYTMLGRRCISNKLDAKPPCSYYNTRTKQWLQPNKNPLTDQCTCYLSLKMKGRLGYTRINKNWCNTTKAVPQGRSASDQIALRKSEAFSCQCWNELLAQMVIGYISDYHDDPSLNGPAWGFHHRSEVHHNDFGSFSGNMNGVEVLSLDLHDGENGITHGIFFELFGLLAENFIKTITLVAPDGKTTTLLLGVGKQISATAAVPAHTRWQLPEGVVSPEQTAFFKDHVGQCIKVYWTPDRTNQSQINNTHLKCHKCRTLFKNPSHRCPSSS